MFIEDRPICHGIAIRPGNSMKAQRITGKTGIANAIGGKTVNNS
jgi:hypothetical protein